MKTKIIITILVIALLAAFGLLALKASGQLTFWEDGSWAIGSYPYPVTGCPAGAYCSTSPGFAFCATWIDSIHDDASWLLTESGVSVADCGGWFEFGE